jgi:hypothetical protein
MNRRTQVLVVPALLCGLFALALWSAPANAAVEVPMNVSTAGSGAGSVECAVNKGLFESCSPQYETGTEVALRGNPAPGSKFTGFSAAVGSAAGCLGLSECSFTITEESGVAATFELIREELGVTVLGPGAGEVRCEVNNGGSFEACAGEYPEGTKLVVHGEPAPGSRFEGFTESSGSAACAGSGDCSFTITEASSVTATFQLIPKDELTIFHAGVGSGNVACEVNGSGKFDPCESEYPENTELVLRGEPEPGSVFEGFSGGTGSAAFCIGSFCPFTIKEASSITATFEPAPKFTLKIKDWGKGTVTSSPSGITCGVTCAAEFEAGTVTLTATPEEGYEFVGWVGCGGDEPECEVSVPGTSEVTAVFLKAAKEGSEGKEGKEGPPGREGATGQEGATGGEGATGQQGAAGQDGAAGKEGAKGAVGGQGATGSAGPEGSSGPTGPQGPGGATGATGLAGAPGSVELVTCTTVKKRGKAARQCTTKVVSGMVKFTATAASTRATLSRHRTVYATGVAESAGRQTRLLLSTRQSLASGRYTLTLWTARSRRSEILTLR